MNQFNAIENAKNQTRLVLSISFLFNHMGTLYTCTTFEIESTLIKFLEKDALHSFGGGLCKLLP